MLKIFLVGNVSFPLFKKLYGATLSSLVQMRSDGDDSLGKSLYFSCLAGCPSLFHSLSLETVLQTRNPELEMKVGLRIYKHADIQDQVSSRLT
jgi:hypothetical protein